MNQQVSQECVVGVRTMRLDFSEDWSSSQRNDPMFAKIIKAIEEDKRPARNEISEESPLMKSYWAQWNSLRAVNG